MRERQQLDGALSGFNSFEVLDLVLVLLALVTLASLAAALGVLRRPLRPGTDLVVDGGLLKSA